MTYSYPAFLTTLGLLLGGAGSTLAQPTITTTTPAANTLTAPRTGPVTVTFSQALQASATAGLKVYTNQGGLRTRGNTPAVLTGSSGNLNGLRYLPQGAGFLAGETVAVSVTKAVSSSSGSLVRPRVLHFTVAASGPGRGYLHTGTNPAISNDGFTLVLGDVDNDGDLDLVTNDNVGRNNGAGVFTAAGLGNSLALFTTLGGLALADVDGDGDLDLLRSYDDSPGNRVLSVSLNGNDASGTATGSFGTGTTVALPNSPYLPGKVLTGDVDGDGDLDAVVLPRYNSGANTVCVRLNGGNANGTTTGTFSNGSDLPVSTLPTDGVLADVDGDGDLDLLLSSATNSVQVLLNGGNASGSGTGAFSNGSSVTVGNTTTGLAVGDVDGDGDLDIATVSYLGSASTVTVRLNGGDNSGSNTGLFSYGSTVAVGTDAARIALADLDGDGDLDLLATNYNTSDRAVVVRLNGGGSTSVNAGTFSGGGPMRVESAPASLAVGDLDGDGDLDIATAPYDNRSVRPLSVRLNQAQALATSASPTAPEASLMVAPTVLAGEAPRYAYAGPALGSEAVLSVYALTGQQVWEQAGVSAATGQLPVANLASGWYVLRLRTATASYTARFYQP